MERREFNESALRLTAHIQAINSLDLNAMGRYLESEEASGDLSVDRQYDLNMIARLIAASEHLIDAAAMGGR